MDNSSSPQGSNTRASEAASGAAAPALAYTNSQPRLRHSEAGAPEQPETFMCRARRVQLGSHRLKLWYLSLCTLGRAGTGVDDVLEIGIKQDSLAGEFETTRKRVVLVLAELRETGLVHVIRSQHHTKIRIFLTPHRPLAVSVDPERGSSGPAAGGSVDPERGSSGLNVSGSPSAVRTCDVRTTYKQQQQQQQHAVSVHPPDGQATAGN